MISRVLQNIINNAFYAVHGKAQQSDSSNKPMVSVSTKKQADQVLISIEDNGHGGLSMSYDIVKSHDGDLQVASELGKGTVFTIQLPV